MNFKTHLSFGLLAALLTYNFFNLTIWAGILFFAFVLLGSLLPDFDKPESKVGRKLGIFSKIFNFIFGHRGVSHSVWFLISFPLLLYLFVNKMLAWALFIGYLSHLISDSLTQMGVNWFHPFKLLRTHGMVQTGTSSETLVMVGVLIVVVFKTLSIFGIF